jgi:serine protease Do
MKRSPIALALCLAAAGAAGLVSSQHTLLGGTKPATSIPAEMSSYRDVVKQVLPAVVSIETTQKQTVAMLGSHEEFPFGDFPGLPDELRKRFGQLPHALPRDPTPHKGIGSGFVVDPKGLIVTNDHVVRNADKVEVRLQDGRKFVSHSIKRDPKTDLAIIQIEAPQSLPYLEFGDSTTMEIGDRVLAVGAPLGMTGTVTSGIISAKGRDIHMNMYEDFLQTDAAINPGNSGGPLVNLEGKVVGVNSAIKSQTGGFQGIGLAISSNMAQTIMKQLLKDGTVHRGYLGVRIQPLDADVAERLGVTDHAGLVIAKVDDGTPAAKAGLKDGDILVAVAGKPVKDARDLQQAVAAMPLGKPVELTVLRDSAKKTLSVTIEEQPKSFAVAQGNEESSSDEGTSATIGKIGVKLMDLTPERTKQLGMPGKTEGVLVAEVEPNSVAAEAGLKAPIVIQKVDGTRVKSTDEAEKALNKGSLEKGILLQVKHPQGGTSFVMLKAASAKR